MTASERDAAAPSDADALAFFASLIEEHHAAESGEFVIAREVQPRVAAVARAVLDDLRALCAEVERLTRERDAERQAREVTFGWYDERRAEVLRLTAEVERLTRERDEARSAVLAEDNLSVVESVVGLMKHRYRHLLPDDHMRELVDEAKDVLDRRAAARTTGGRDA